MIILHNINHNFSIFKDTSQDLTLNRAILTPASCLLYSSKNLLNKKNVL